MRQAVCSLVLMIMVSVGYAKTRPPYIECQSSEECGKGACCVIGMGRFSIPTCRPRPDLGDSCRPLGEPANTTLHYPDGAVVELTGVYYQHCPCLGASSCGAREDDTPRCAENSQLSTNHVYDYSSQSFEDIGS